MKEFNFGEEKLFDGWKDITDIEYAMPFYKDILEQMQLVSAYSEPTLMTKRLFTLLTILGIKSKFKVDTDLLQIKDGELEELNFKNDHFVTQVFLETGTSNSIENKNWLCDLVWYKDDYETKELKLAVECDKLFNVNDQYRGAKESFCKLANIQAKYKLLIFAIGNDYGSDITSFIDKKIKERCFKSSDTIMCIALYDDFLAKKFIYKIFVISTCAKIKSNVRYCFLWSKNECKKVTHKVYYWLKTVFKPLFTLWSVSVFIFIIVVFIICTVLWNVLSCSCV